MSWLRRMFRRETDTVTTAPRVDRRDWAKREAFDRKLELEARTDLLIRRRRVLERQRERNDEH